ncbi:MAG: hypothetical protein L0170_02420 [Acidobacteria bacterium]|nr:hypothetical protein [Acidobacteriota bacterium]
MILRKVDIVDWDSAAAKQAHEEFKLEGIPYLRIYDGNGRFVSEVSGADIDEVKQAVQSALAR